MLECFAMFHALRKFRPIIFGEDITLVTDHRPLVAILRNKSSDESLPNAMQRWLLFIRTFDILNVIYKPGKDMGAADELSRDPLEEAEPEGDTLNIFSTEITSEPMKTSIQGDANRIDADKNSPNSENNSLREFQNSDKEVLFIKAHILTGERSKKEKHLFIKDGVLFYKRPDTQFPVPYLPKKLRKLILHEAHDSILLSHPGINKTGRFISDRYFWFNMSSQIKAYVKSCLTCQQVKASRIKPQGFYSYKNIQDLPLRRYEMDLQGPLPRSKRGNKYIITLICQFSRFMIMAPIPNGNSEDVAKFLIDRIILKYGSPIEILSDNGTHFTSGIIKELMKLLQIDHKFGTIYNFRSIGSCERHHDIINTKLRAFVSEKCDNWDAFLPYFEFAMNSSYSTATGTTPFKILYGFDAIVPSQLAYGIHKYDFISNVESRWNAARELAQETLLNN